MTGFKRTNLFLWLLAMLTFTACVKAGKHDLNASDGQKITQFRMSGEQLVDVSGYAENLIQSDNISKVDGGVRDTQVQDATNAAYSNLREYNLKLCGLYDIRVKQTMVGQKLKVYSELPVETDGSEPGMVTIKGDNCVYFRVVMGYDHFAPAVNLQVNFIFLTIGGAKSYISKSVLINPWDAQRGDNPEFLDYTRVGLSEAMRKLPAAQGLKQINDALVGKYIIAHKKLEVGSLQIFPVDKQFVETNMLGSVLNADVEAGRKANEEKRKNEEFRARLQQANASGENGTEPNQPYETFKSLDLHLNIRLNNLKVRLKNSIGENYDEELKTGRYRIYAQLVATDINNKGHYLITDKMIISDEKNWTTSTMGVNAVLPISLVIRPQWGNLNLVLKVVPTDLAGIEPFEAMYVLGRFNEIAGGKSPLFSLSDYALGDDNSITFSYDDYIQKAVNHADWEKGLASRLDSKSCLETRNGKVSKIPGCNEESTLERGFRRFQFTPLNVLFSRVMSGDTATDRTIQYTVETCVVDNLTGGRPGGGLVFKIETEDRGQVFQIERKTNELGCLNWVGMISHKVYHRENLINKVSKLTFKDVKSGEDHYNLDYYINPWDEKFTFGRDSRILPMEYINQVKKQQAIAPSTRLLMTDFRYDATGFRYSIDKYMTMTVKKTVLMTIKPKILKYNSIVWGRSGSSEVRDGIYLMKIAMQKDYLDPTAKGQVVHASDAPTGPDGTSNSIEEKQFLVVKEMLVRVLGGLIITPVEFDVTDLRTLRIRSQMLIQLETIDEMLLRAIVLANSRLTDLIGAPGTTKTQDIVSAQAEEDEVNRKLEAAKAQADSAELRQTIAKLNQQKDGIVKRLESLLASMDPAASKALLASIDRIRSLGEEGISVDRNLKYTELNNILSGMRKRLDSNQKAEVNSVQTNFAASQEEECAKMYSSLLAQGRKAEAEEMYKPDSGKMCFKKIPPDELFYHLVSSKDVETDTMLKSLFTKEQFEAYKTGALVDDFTNAYVPDYDFSLLSNEGDELLASNPDFTSGLPRRTFIGPVTFVLNGNGSALRPTDVLDEASCQGTCEQLAENENEVINNSAGVQDVVKNFGLPVNSAYEESPYFGSVKHFYKKQVDDLIAMERGLRYQYHQEMIAFSKVGNLLERSGINYVSFNGKTPVLKYLDYNCYADWKKDIELTYSKWRDNIDKSYTMKPISSSCFLSSNRGLDMNKYMRSLNGQVEDEENMIEDSSNLGGWKLPPVDVQTMREFSKNGLVSPKLTLETKVNILHRLCYKMRLNLVPNNMDSYRATMQKRLRGYMGMDLFNVMMTLVDFEDDCHKKVRQFSNEMNALGNISQSQLIDAIGVKSQKLPMIIERKVRVLETSNQYIYKDGKTINYSVGYGFSLSNSFNVNRGLKIDPIETAEKSIGMLGGIGRAISGVIGALGGVLNFQWGEGESQAASNGTAVTSGTTIAGQISTLDIELKKWEKCVVVRIDDQTLLNVVAKLKDVSQVYSPSEDIQGLGTMMCSGDEDTEDDLRPGQPLRLRERYYYFTQIFNDGDMQDPGALFNHPWMLQMRGVRDFTQFHKALTVSEKKLDWGSAFSMFGNDTAYMLGGMVSDATGGAVGSHSMGLTSLEVVSPNDIQKALDMMAAAYAKSLPTFPSMYTYGDTSADEVTSWPVKRP